MTQSSVYDQAIGISRENLADLQKRGTDAIGEDALAFMDTLLTPDEIAESDLRASLISELIKARKEKGISQKNSKN